MASENLGDRDRAIRSRTRALAALLVALVALFYVIALVRLGGG